MVGLGRRYYYPVATASAVGTGASTDITVTKPTGTVSGDIMVAVMFTGDFAAYTWTGDTGWTEIVDQAAFPDMRIAYKVAGGGEGASYTFTASGNIVGLAAIITFRGLQYDTIGASIVTRTGNGSLTMTEITSAGGVLLAAVVSAGPSNSPTHTVPTGMQLAYSGTSNNDRLSIYYQTINSGATGTRTSTIGSNAGEDSAGILIGLKP